MWANQSDQIGRELLLCVNGVVMLTKAGKRFSVRRRFLREKLIKKRG